MNIVEVADFKRAKFNFYVCSKKIVFEIAFLVSSDYLCNCIFLLRSTFNSVQVD